MISKGELTRFKYDLRKDKIGEGAFGKVYKAYDTYLDRTVALKIGERREMNGKVFSLTQEIEAVQHLPIHPNIAYYDQVFEEESIHGIFEVAVMQYYEDGNLRDHIVNQFIKLTPDIKKSLILGILEGIKHLHKHKVIHRDLKTSNILLVKRQDGLIIPKITDFGLSKAINSSENSYFTNSFVGGTIDYSPPEQLGGGIVGYSADIWSFGAIIYEIITGLKLFKQSGSSSNQLGQVEIMNNILRANLPESITTLPTNIQQIIRSCIVVDSNSRISLNEIQTLITSENIKVDIAPIVNFNDIDEHTIILKENGIDQDLLFKMKDPDYYSKFVEEEARRKAEEEARIKAEEEARKKAEEEARIKAEVEARRKAEEEARIKVEEEARRKAKEEARIKAEEETRRKAEEEARIKAEEEARTKAEEEARRKAEEEARTNAEEEARRKAEEEARTKAEEEVRRKAEEEARIKAEEEEEEEEARRKVEEEARTKAEEEALRKVEEEARIKAEEEVHRKAEEEARIKAEEEARIKAEEVARRKAEKEARIKAETLKKVQIEAHRKAEEEDRRKEAELKAKRKAEEEALIKKKKEEELAKKLAEEEARKKKKEEELRLKAEDKKRKALEVAGRKQKLKEEGKKENKLLVFWGNNKLSITATAVVLFGILGYTFLPKTKLNPEFVFNASFFDDSLAWNNAYLSGNIEDIQSYITSFPKGIFINEANKKLDSLSTVSESYKEEAFWDEVLKTNNENSYSGYLNKYPQGKFISIAALELKRIKEMNNAKSEDEAYSIAKKNNTIEAFESFLIIYPDSKQTREINKIIQDLKNQRDKENFNEVIKLNTIPDLDAYIKQNPSVNNKYIEQAKAQLQKLYDEKIEIERQAKMKSEFDKAMDNLEELIQLSKIYPSYNKINDIEQRIKILQEKRIDELKRQREVPEPPGIKPSDNIIMPEEKPLPFIITQIENALVPISGAKNNTFKILETEVTQNMWMTVMGGNPSRFKECEKCPVENVSFKDAIAFIEKLNGMQSKFKYSLPSESQWEYAASNKGKYSEYAGGTDLSVIGVYKLNSKNGTAIVKSKKSNGIGLYDMSGNVYEWTNTSANGDEVVIKGGSWKDPASSAEIKSKGYAPKDEKSSSIGFRIIRQ